jgi:hypothetical protein
VFAEFLNGRGTASVAGCGGSPSHTVGAALSSEGPASHSASPPRCVHRRLDRNELLRHWASLLTPGRRRQENLAVRLILKGKGNALWQEISLFLSSVSPMTYLEPVRHPGFVDLELDDPLELLVWSTFMSISLVPWSW